jgi:predicted ATPase
MVGQSWMALAGALGAGGSNRAAHAIPWPDRNLAFHACAASRSDQTSGRADNSGGYAAPETKAAEERARLLIEQAEALGEPPEDPLLIFSVLYGFWVANLIAFDGDAVRELAAEFLALAEKQGTTVPLIIGHRITGNNLLHTGNIAHSRAHLDRAFALYDFTMHREQAMRFGHDARVAILSHRSLALWLAGYPDSALADAAHALQDALFTYLPCWNYTAATAEADELIALAEEKGASYWKALGTLFKGSILAMTGEASQAIQLITSGTASWRSTGATVFMPFWLSLLAIARADAGEFDEALRSIDEAMACAATTKETWCEAEIHRLAGEITLKLPNPNMAKAEAYFRALAKT